MSRVSREVYEQRLLMAANLYRNMTRKWDAARELAKQFGITTRRGEQLYCIAAKRLRAEANVDPEEHFSQLLDSLKKDIFTAESYALQALQRGDEDTAMRWKRLGLKAKSQHAKLTGANAPQRIHLTTETDQEAERFFGMAGRVIGANARTNGANGTQAPSNGARAG